jgi:hypothetical protein
MKTSSIYNIVLPPFRKRRMRAFVDRFLPNDETRILDVGGTPMNWLLVNSQSQITLLNLYNPKDMTLLPRNFNCVIGDGTRLGYGDREFDICFSNSVIEHLGSFENQILFAQETRRVACKVWVQTPAKSFFFEPHFLTPFIHYFPRRIQEKLVRNFTLWGLLTRPSQEKVKAFLDELRLLTYDEMVELFPDCEIKVERFFGLVKAYIAFRI